MKCMAMMIKGVSIGIAAAGVLAAGCVLMILSMDLAVAAAGGNVGWGLCLWLAAVGALVGGVGGAVACHGDRS